METIVRLVDGRLVISHARGLPADAARYWSDRWNMWREPVLRLSETHDELEARHRSEAERKDPWRPPDLSDAGLDVSGIGDRTTWPP